MGDFGYHMEALRKTRVLQKKKEALLRLGLANGTRPTETTQLPPNTYGYTEAPLNTKLGDSGQTESYNYYRSDSTSNYLQPRTPAGFVRDSNRGLMTPQYTPQPPQTPAGLGDTLPQTPDIYTMPEPRSVYSRSEFPEFDDDRELFDTFSYP